MMSKFSDSPYSLRELAEAINADIIGSEETAISGASNFAHAQKTDLVFVAEDRSLPAAKASQAGAFLLAKPCHELNRPQLITPHPQLSFIHLIEVFFTQHPAFEGIDPSCRQGQNVTMGNQCAIGPFVSIGNEVTIGEHVRLYSSVVLEDNVVIGDHTILFPNVTVLKRCVIGSRVIIHSGAVIGSDGFGYIQHEGTHRKIPQLGNVIIENDVELGANVTIDRATFGHTTVKQGTKIDNQVQIAHNVTIEENCMVIAQVGIAGSTHIGQNVMIGGQAGLVDHLTIGKNAKIAAGAGIMGNVEEGKIMAGLPAFERHTWLKSQALLKKLPELKQRLQELEKRVKELENPEPGPSD